MFEFSGPYAACGETPYLKLLSQLFGEPLLVTNATGCSSIYGGKLPNTPWKMNKDGRGPAWSNSLFEDNAEFGLGMQITAEKQLGVAKQYLLKLKDELGATVIDDILNAKPVLESELAVQHLRVTIIGVHTLSAEVIKIVASVGSFYFYYTIENSPGPKNFSFPSPSN